MKRLISIILLLFTISSLFGCDIVFNNPGDSLGGGGTVNETPESTDTNDINDDIDNLDTDDSKIDLDADFDDLSNYTIIDLADNNTIITGSGASLDGRVIKITAEGTYYLTGTLNDGTIYVNYDGNVRIILDGVSITSKDSAAIVIMGKKKKVITLVDGTISTLTDANNYQTYYDDEKTEPNAALFSKKALTINGLGTLIVNGNNNNGIGCKDELRILDATIITNAINNGLKGNDNIIIKNANITITSTEDGMKSDSEDEGLGNILITDSSLSITSAEDAIQAYRYVFLENNTIVISTNGGASNNTSSNTPGNRPNWWEQENSSSNETSRKGIKSDCSIKINSGFFELDTYDDAIHSNEVVIINAGIFNIKSGDDAIHGDVTVEINGGDINILKSYEGIEGASVSINDGNINIVSSDDGINASSDANQKNCSIIINGGFISIDASGDGIDSNGSVLFTGGQTIIHGPTSSGNAALDADYGILMNGGILSAAGALGMVETPATNSLQNVISIATSTTQKAGGEVTIKNSSGLIIHSFTSTKTFQSLIVSSNLFNTSEKYTIYINGTELTSVTITSTITEVGSKTSGGGWGRP